MPINSIDPNSPGLDTSIASGQRITASRSIFAFDLAAGATVATLRDPFGAGSTYAVKGTPSAQLALSGSSIVKGAGAASVGSDYAITIIATSADGQREVTTRLTFGAVYPLGGVRPNAPPLLPLPLISQRVPISAAYDSAGDAAVVAALVASGADISLPEFTVAAGATRSVAVRLAPVKGRGAYATFLGSFLSFGMTIQRSFDSTNGQDGTWADVPFIFIEPNSIRSLSRQAAKLAADARPSWVRYNATAGSSATTFNVTVLQLFDDRANDAHMIEGASIEELSMSSRAMETAIRAAYPGRDVHIFTAAWGGQRSQALIDLAPQALAAWGDLISCVLDGNVIGNDFTALAAYNLLPQADRDETGAKFRTLLTMFTAKNVFAHRISYRQYDAPKRTSPLFPDLGSLTWNTALVDPAIAAYDPDLIHPETRSPRLDMYAVFVANRLEMSDGVHPGGLLGPRIRAEWIRVVFARIYTGAWPAKHYAELVVEEYEASRTVHDRARALFAVRSLPSSPKRQNLLERIVAIAPTTRTTPVQVNVQTTTAKAGWNDTRILTGSDSGQRTLLDAGNLETAYGVELFVTGAASSAGAGATGTSGAAAAAGYDDAVLATALSAETITALVSGLVVGKSYRVTAIGSLTGSGTRNVDYVAIGGSTPAAQTLNVFGNASAIVDFTVQPAADGTIQLVASKGAGNTTNARLSAFTVQMVA